MSDFTAYILIGVAICNFIIAYYMWKLTNSVDKDDNL